MTDTEGQEVILLGMGPSGPRTSKDLKGWALYVRAGGKSRVVAHETT